MHNFFKKSGKVSLIIFTFIIGLSLIISSIVMLNNYQKNVKSEAYNVALYNTVGTRSIVQDGLNSLISNATSIGALSSSFDDMNDLRMYFNEEAGKRSTDGTDYDIVYIRYQKDGVFYDSYGDEITTADPARDYLAEGNTEANYVGTFTDTLKNMFLVGFYSPVVNSDLIDGVEIIYTYRRLEKFFEEDYHGTNAEYSILINSDGDIIVGDTNTSSDTNAIPFSVDSLTEGNYNSILRETVGQKATVESFKKLVKSGEDSTLQITINSKDYILSIGSNKEKMRDLSVVELYDVELICASDFDFAYSLVTIIIIFVCLSVFVICWLIFMNIKFLEERKEKETKNKELGCLNKRGFMKKANQILNRNTNSYFVVLVIEIKHFSNILDIVGEVETNKMLSFIKVASEKQENPEECFCYDENGVFITLAHNKDENALIDRLKNFSFIVSKYSSRTKLDINLKFGIYEVNKYEKITIDRMIEMAILAKNSATRATSSNALMQFNFYTPDIVEEKTKNENMELKMEGALKNGEFQIFFQPKYNLNTNKMDGSEVLVRWFDPKTKVFNPPSLFMNLFETNGFITKLDRYVFEKACEFLSYSIAQGRHVFLTSVNVSRITAVQPDFIDFYVKTKRKYGIRDGLIMIEFTESFAYENYDTMLKIVDKLHANGFKCSVDDFGCGYSSFLILKSLPMDEIKLDKIFLDKGINKDRDDVIYRSIVQLGKSLNMKVTQEGVETLEDLAYIRSMGCDVLQGYLYSKPVVTSDFIKFSQKSFEHNLE